MIRIAVFDNKETNREAIKQIIAKYTAQQNIDFDVLWFFEDINKDKIEKYISSVNISLISLDLEHNGDISQIVYDNNEDCRILYYSSFVRDLEPLLCVRPRGFHLMSRGEAAFVESLDDIVTEVRKSKNNFYHETRKDIFVIPLKSIIYFQSDLKYVIIKIKNKESERIYSKLSAIEPYLNKNFLRIHKSYILNTDFVDQIDKSNKTIILNNGEILPISDVNYKTVINYFLEREKEYGKRKIDRN